MIVQQRQNEYVRYDAQCRNVMRDVNLIAYACKISLLWCRNMSIGAIKQCLWAANPKGMRAGKIFLQKFHGENVELDLCVLIFNPILKSMEVINIEVQNDYYPGYLHTKRANVYAAEMLTHQKGIAYEGDDYNSQWQVHLIIIFKHPPKYLRNRVIRFPNFEIHKEDYCGYDFSDTTTKTFIHIGDKDKTDDPLLRLFDIVFNEADAETIYTLVKKEYEFELMKGDLEIMSNWGVDLANHITRKNNIQFIITMMNELNFDIERAMNLLKISHEQKPLYRMLVAEEMEA